jgi:4-hydroxy-tetrahydrodipicolinate synthase
MRKVPGDSTSHRSPSENAVDPAARKPTERPSVPRSPEVVVALLSPFTKDGRLDGGALAAHIEFLVDSGVDALMPGGTTGEGPLLDDVELLDVAGRTFAAARGRLRVIPHVGRAATTPTATLIEHTVSEHGATAVSALVPYYYTLNDDQVRRHFQVLLHAAEGCDLYAYTIPTRTGNELTTGVVRRLRADGLRGVKDSTKSWQRHRAYLKCGVDVLIGTDSMVVDSFRAGSAGCVSALANVRPDLLCRARQGEDVQDEISQLRERLPFHKLKLALAERLPGYPTKYRAPLG